MRKLRQTLPINSARKIKDRLPKLTGFKSLFHLISTYLILQTGTEACHFWCQDALGEGLRYTDAVQTPNMIRWLPPSRMRSQFIGPDSKPTSKGCSIILGGEQEIPGNTMKYRGLWGLMGNSFLNAPEKGFWWFLLRMGEHYQWLAFNFVVKIRKKKQNAFMLEIGIDPKCKIVYKWDKQFLRCKFPRIIYVCNYVYLWYFIILGWVPHGGVLFGYGLHHFPTGPYWAHVRRSKGILMPSITSIDELDALVELFLRDADPRPRFVKMGINSWKISLM